jgi:membrane protein
MNHRLAVSIKFLHFVGKNFMRNAGLENAKSLTFTSLFAVVPLLTLIVAILSAFPSFQVFGAQVQDMIYERLLPSTSNELKGYLTDFSGQARNLTWAGAIMLFATAYVMLVSIETNFNRIWGVSEQRKGTASFLLYWSVLSLGPLLLGVGFAISSYIASLTLFDAFTDYSAVLGGRSLVLGLFPLVLTTIAFTLLYVAVPNCGVNLRHGFYGALAVTLTFVLVKWIFSRFIATASYALIYGTFAAIPIFLLWIYVCWVVILFGANLVRSIPLYGSTAVVEEVHPTLLLLALLHRFWEKQQSGEVLRVGDLLAEKWPFRVVTADDLLSFLEAQHIIHSFGEDEYMLARDLEALSIWDLLQNSPWPLPAAEVLDRPVPAFLQQNLPELPELIRRFRQIQNLMAREFSVSLGAYFREQTMKSVKPRAFSGILNPQSFKSFFK